MTDGTLDLNTLHKVARLIEVDGAEAFHTVTKLVGRDLALGMLIMQMRANARDPKLFTPDNYVRATVDQKLSDERII